MMGEYIIWQIIALLTIHWFADFVLQTHWQASNKSKNIEALCRHIITYSAALSVGVSFVFWKSALSAIIYFCVVNTMLHLATDYVTSKITARLYERKDFHNFFVVVGLDQLIHQVTLITTVWLMLT